MTFFDDYLARHRDFLSFKAVEISFTRCMTVVEYTWGHLILTEFVDSEETTTLEVLKSWNERHAVLINRERFGYAHNDMRSYLRDNYYPVGCLVKLVRND